jgi:cell wall-associated NlpC family hydrolase
LNETFDRRVTPARPDLAAMHLKNVVAASRYVEGAIFQVRESVIDMRRDPRPDCAVDTQLLYGERVTLYDEEEGWGWVQAARDAYVGWVALNALWSRNDPPTHRVTVARTFIYPGPSIKLPPITAMPLGGDVTIIDERGDFLVTPEQGFIWRAHLAPLDRPAADFVAVAEMFIGAPYLWGGKSSLGVDCSGLVQISLLASGVNAPRDSDMQAAALGESLAPDATLQRGDFVFWKGHVGIMRDPVTLLHANGTHMLVSSELLALVRERNLAAGAGDITGFRRLSRHRV